MTRVLTIRGWQPAGLILSLLLAVSGCGGGSASQVAGPTSDPAQQPGQVPFDFGPNNPLRASAFGDSITVGVLGDVDGQVIATGNNYPNNLQLALRTLNPAWRVINRGLGGERSFEGVRRLPGVLALDRPGFVLIMEGTNDADEGESAASIVANLEAMVIRAQANHTIPVIGTIPPNFRNDPRAQGTIQKANPLIRAMAEARKVVLAEIFDGMNDRSLFGSPERGIPDPLHPNERGYVRMASIWFAAMQKAIPLPPPPPAPATPPPSSNPPPTESGQRPTARLPRR